MSENLTPPEIAARIEAQVASLVGAAGGCSYYRQGQDRCTAAGITALLDGVGSTLVRLDIYKKGNVDREATGTAIAER